MNSASSAKTYIKMQNQLLSDDDCACYLVEAIAAKAQNKLWTTTVDKRGFIINGSVGSALINFMNWLPEYLMLFTKYAWYCLKLYRML